MSDQNNFPQGGEPGQGQQSSEVPQQGYGLQYGEGGQQQPQSIPAPSPQGSQQYGQYQYGQQQAQQYGQYQQPYAQSPYGQQYAGQPAAKPVGSALFMGLFNKDTTGSFAKNYGNVFVIVVAIFGVLTTLFSAIKAGNARSSMTMGLMGDGFEFGLFLEIFLLGLLVTFIAVVHTRILVENAAANYESSQYLKKLAESK